MIQQKKNQFFIILFLIILKSLYKINIALYFNPLIDLNVLNCI